VASVEQIGQGQLGLQAARLGSAELDQLVQSINLMSHSLQAEDIRHRREMSKARQIQDHLLPGRVQVPGLQIDHLYLPAAGVAGDYYDVLPLPAGASLVCIADVTGHGIPAAMTAAMLKAFLLHAIEHHDRPNEILRFLDQRFSSMALPGDFASVWLARWDPNTSQLTYSSAGHESGWLITASGVEELRSTGPVLGVFTEATWQLEQVDVHAGERLILFTDGFTEAIAPNGELLGRSHLPKLLSHCRSLDFPDVIPRLKSEFDRHLAGRAQDDDLTIVVVEFSRGMTDRAAAPMLPTAAVVGTSADSRR
jgi:sigma-B regulation protein RsbU (phosphoserine phosphatase)